MDGKLFLLLILNLFPPYGYVARYFLLQTCKDKTKSGRLTGMIESGFFHPALRILSPEERLLINSTYSSLKKGKDLSKVNSEVVLSEGYKSLGKLVSPEDCESVVSYFKEKKGFLSQVPMQSDGILYSYDEAERLGKRHGRYFSFAPGTSLKNSVVRDLVKNDLVKSIVRTNLADGAELYSINTFVVFPGESVDHYVMNRHRDYDDFNFIAFFIYWTGVTADNGATLYIPKTNISSNNELLQHKVFLEGSPGSAFAFDGFGFHSGNNAVKTTRIVTWFRYGLRNNLTAVLDGWPLHKVNDALTL
jgi:hypothetical protein